MPIAVARLAVLAALVLLSGCTGKGSVGGNGTPPASPTTGPSVSTTSASSSPVGQTVAVTVAGGKVTPKPARVRVALGKPLTLRVTSDVADEVHVHGYDLKRDVPAGGTATVSFTPDVPGLFEVELESRGLRLLELQVS